MITIYVYKIKNVLQPFLNFKCLLKQIKNKTMNWNIVKSVIKYSVIKFLLSTLSDISKDIIIGKLVFKVLT